MKKVLTLAYLVGEKQVCLAMKKRGFGEGETVWVRNAGSISQGSSRFFLKIRRVDSFCKKTVARGCR
jgi:hypothetical protein